MPRMTKHAERLDAIARHTTATLCFMLRGRGEPIHEVPLLVKAELERRGVDIARLIAPRAPSPEILAMRAAMPAELKAVVYAGRTV